MKLARMPTAAGNAARCNAVSAPVISYSLQSHGLSQACLLRHHSFFPVRNSTLPSSAARKLLYVASLRPLSTTSRSVPTYSPPSLQSAERSPYLAIRCVFTRYTLLLLLLFASKFLHHIRSAAAFSQIRRMLLPKIRAVRPTCAPILPVFML